MSLTSSSPPFSVPWLTHLRVEDLGKRRSLPGVKGHRCWVVWHCPPGGSSQTPARDFRDGNLLEWWSAKPWQCEYLDMLLSRGGGLFSLLVGPAVSPVLCRSVSTSVLLWVSLHAVRTSYCSYNSCSECHPTACYDARGARPWQQRARRLKRVVVI